MFAIQRGQEKEYYISCTVPCAASLEESVAALQKVSAQSLESRNIQGHDIILQ